MPDGKKFSKVTLSFPTGIPNNTTFYVYADGSLLESYTVNNTPVNTTHTVDINTDPQVISLEWYTRGNPRSDWTYRIDFEND